MRGVYAIFAALLILAAGTSAARAQSSSDLQAMNHRLELLQNDLADLQRYVYSGQGEPMAVLPSTDLSGGADTQMRLQQLEERIRLLTGQVEEMQFAQRQNAEKLDAFMADIDARFAALGQAGAPVATGETGTADTATATDDNGAGTLTGDDLTAGESGDADVGAVAATGALPAGSEMDQYNYAFSLLRKADYDGAEIAFNEFISLHPQSDLTGNAYYWLGETYYVRNAYQDAAIAFLKGYQQFPGGDKAPDNLLKLGMTLTRLDKKAEACATFKELQSKFPEAPQTVRDKATQEASAAGC